MSLPPKLAEARRQMEAARPQRDAMTMILDEIQLERARQIEDKGWDTKHDDEHENGEMLTAGWGALARIHSPTRRSLVEAAALIVAEIERLDRAWLKRAEALGPKRP